MKTLKGDLIQLATDGHFDIIIHGCNCFCTMGAGIAATISSKFPEAFQADTATSKGDKDKLGTYSQATVKTRGTKNSHSVTIINGYTQYNYSGDGVLVDYRAVETLFAALKTDFPNMRFGYPKIGAGLAGGNWDILSAIIERELAGEDHTLVLFQR